MSRPLTETQVIGDLRDWIEARIYQEMPSINYVPKDEVGDFTRLLVRAVMDGRLPGLKLDLGMRR